MRSLSASAGALSISFARLLHHPCITLIPEKLVSQENLLMLRALPYLISYLIVDLVLFDHICS